VNTRSPEDYESDQGEPAKVGFAEGEQVEGAHARGSRRRAGAPVEHPPAQQLEVRTPVVAEDDELAVEQSALGRQRVDGVHDGQTVLP
jgi:hypothetical protein